MEKTPKPSTDLPEALPSGDPVTLSDRKSTRLNSSHLVISYAVFCLKKKQKLRRLVFDGTQGALYNTIVCVRTRGGLVLGLVAALQNDAADARRLRLHALTYRFVHRH